MQTQVGVIKQISGLVVAVDQNGVSRVFKSWRRFISWGGCKDLFGFF
ncbi:hypothetical protein [Campylobacter concisus]|nr:hypothetical protein [Campylobacter concisus]